MAEEQLWEGDFTITFVSFEFVLCECITYSKNPINLKIFKEKDCHFPIYSVHSSV